MPPAGDGPGRGDLVRRGRGATQAVGTEAPEVHERADRGVEGAVRGFGDLEGAADDELEVRRNRDGFVRAGAVEARDLAVGVIGGHLAVDLGQRGIDVGLQAAEFAAFQRRRGQANGIGRAHGLAGERGGARSGSAGGEGNQKSNIQYPMFNLQFPRLAAP